MTWLGWLNIPSGRIRSWHRQQRALRHWDCRLSLFCAVLIGTLEKCCNLGCWPDVRSRIVSRWLNLLLAQACSRYPRYTTQGRTHSGRTESA
jgi:hypothetical protein